MRSYLPFILSIILFLTSCNKDDDSVPIQTQINDWILAIMSDVYLWNDQIPSQVNKNLSPEQFFESLLFSGDRFSVIFPDYDELINALEGISKEAGYSVLRVKENDSDNVLFVINYVQPGSPADEKGLRRGDIIIEVNDTRITLQNLSNIIDQTGFAHDVKYQRFNDETEEYDVLSASLSVAQLMENPNFLDTVYTTSSGKKVGYYIYNFFSAGPGSTSTYNDQMDAIFENFKAKGIDELILDFRYNGGGSISSALNLGSLIAPNVDDQDIFYQNQWNERYQSQIEAREDGDRILRGRFLSKNSNIGSLLTSGKLYVITTGRTASASELIVNGLTPYMDVITIGQTSVGKNVGSIAIEDEDNDANNYGMLPITFQVANSLGTADYANGFSPDPENELRELDFLPFKELGDIEDPLLAQTLSLIDPSMGGRLSGRQLQPFAEERFQLLEDEKIRSQKLVLDIF